MRRSRMWRTAVFASVLLMFAGDSLRAETRNGETVPMDDYAFLVKYMSAKDRGKVSEEYLRANVALAREALRAAPWRETVTKEIFREYILPYSSIDEEVDDWRPLFRKLFWPLVKDCKTTGEAVQKINSEIGRTLGVHYSTKRDKPDQSPFHSMRIHMASCTGLTILQVDVYRACGIPARFTGCNWTTIPGNHSWAEYYDNGMWHFFNDPEDGKLAPPDKAWFVPYAAMADASNPRTRIYAARWSPGNASFRLPWRNGGAFASVPADDVTANYRRFYDGLSKSRLAFVARAPDGTRVPAAFRLTAPGTGSVLAEGITYDESHDMNDHFAVALPKRTKVRIEIKAADGSFRPVGEAEFGEGQKLVELKLADSGAANGRLRPVAVGR